MNLLSRRLYNGGFNHLKSTVHLLRKAPRVVNPHLGATRLCSTTTSSGGSNDVCDPSCFINVFIGLFQLSGVDSLKTGKGQSEWG